MIDFNNAGPQRAEQINGVSISNSSDLEAVFLEKMVEYKLNPGGIASDGRLHRFDVDKKGDKAGWYVFYPGDIAAGAFGNWKESLFQKWCSRETSTLTGEQWQAYTEKQKIAKETREREEKENHSNAKIRANQIWSEAEPITGQNHPYLQKKNIQPHHTRLSKNGDLIVPEIDEYGEIWSLQFIKPDGQKRFQPFGRRDGLYFEIIGTEHIYLCEGFSTGATIAEVTGATVMCAFNSGSLPKVARVLKKKYLGRSFTIAADNDQYGDKNIGVLKAKEASKILNNSPVVIPTFSNTTTQPTDLNDLAALEGIRAVKMQVSKAVTNKLSPRKGLSALTVQGDYVAMIGNEAWIFQNLIIKNQIVVIVAKSGGGKTTISFDFLAPWIIKNRDMTVYYFDLDSPASDHRRMFEKAQEVEPKLQWVNPLTHGKSVDELMEIVKELTVARERLDDAIFWFDTQKKFIDMLDKKSVKPFFTLLRQLTALGATIVLLGHANKHRDIGGNLVFEGVGDVVSDSDALIFFERISAPDGGNYITTVCDPDKGAKVRGLYEPISFHIAKDRTVTLRKEVVPVPDWSPGGAKNNKLTEEEIQDRIRDFLADRPDPISQSMITGALMGEPGGSYHRVRNTLIACAVPQHQATEKGQIYCIEGNQVNKKMYGVK